MKTSDLLASLDYDMTPTDNDEALANADFTALLTAAGMPSDVRRRLLIFATLKVWGAKGLGAAAGLGSSLLAAAATVKASSLAVGALAMLGVPATGGLSLIAGMAAGAAVTSLVKTNVDAAAVSLVSTISGDAAVTDAFQSSLAFGSTAHNMLNGAGVYSPKDLTSAKLTRLLDNSQAKVKEWAWKSAQSRVELAWAQANKDNPAVAKLLPDMLAKDGAIRRLAATAADVARADWKAVAKAVVNEGVLDAGLDAAAVLASGLAEALEPTPGE